MHYFFFRELQLITVFLLIRSFYTNWNTWLIFLKLCVGFSIFVFVSFLLNFIFLFTKSMDSLTLKLHNSFQNKNNRKARHSLLPDLWFLSSQQGVLKVNDIRMSWNSLKTDLETNFLNLENWSFEYVTFSKQ